MKKLSPSRNYTGLTDEQLQQHAAEVAARLASLREQMAALGALCQQEVADQQAIADEQARLKLAQPGPLDWAWLLADDPQASEVRYKAARNAVREFAMYQSHAGLTADGTNAHTGQRVPKVALLRGVPALTRQVETALTQMLPHIMPCTPERRYNETVKYVSVFEASLSEFGTYYLAIDEARSVFELRKTRYGSQTLFKAESLGALLDHVEQNCYYEDRTAEQVTG